MLFCNITKQRLLEYSLTTLIEQRRNTLFPSDNSNSYPMTPISKNLEALRKRLNLNQTTVADYLGVTHTVVSNYETGKYNPTHEHLTKLAALFDVEIADLLEHDAAQKVVNLAFAFRADSIDIEDLKSITKFKQIVKNYLKLYELNEAL